MRRPVWLIAAALMLSTALLASACGSAQQPAPEPPPTQTEPQPSPPPQNTDNPTSPENPSASPGGGEPEVPDLPGDKDALRNALKAETQITYTVVIATDAPREMDKTAYLDQMLAEQGYPGKNEILLVIFPADNYNIRFAMGALVFDRKISLQQMLEMVQNQYLARSRRGDAAGGLADLINAINEKVK